MSRLSHGRRELLFFLAANWIYDAPRWLAKGDAVAARAHAHWIAGVERSAGVAASSLRPAHPLVMP